MTLIVPTRTKKNLKEQVGRPLTYHETVPSWLPAEYKSTGVVFVTTERRNWFAKVTMKDDVIVRVE